MWRSLISVVGSLVIAGVLGASCREATGPSATQLAFIVQPAITMAGHSIMPAVQVEIRDASGTRRTDAAGSVVIAIGTNPDSGTLSGTATVVAIGGVAIFSGLSIDNPGVGYTLTATARGLTGATSAGFTVTGFASVSAGGTHTCALTPDGAAYCWGDNGSGQLGDSSTVSSSTPVPVSGGLIFAAISAGSDSGHTCGVTTAGAVYCWGLNDYGQLGSAAAPGSTTPALVAGGLTFATVSAGWKHTCAVTTVGQAYCWGSDFAGELGNGAISGGATPVPVVGGLSFAAVSAGNFLTCGVTTGGAAYCWGAAGRLGDGLPTPDSVPAAVVGGLTFTSVRSASHSCGVTNGGSAYCWGWNSDGQLGDGSTDSSLGYEREAPVEAVGGHTFADVTVGFWFSCGVTTAGGAYCWGTDSTGQLGIGSTSGPQLCYIVACSPTPVPVSSGYRFADVSAGNFHACGLTRDGAVYCWGDNSRGQLGNGSTVNSSTPVRTKNP
jgi:alpha-tubulin suppressor-like RCC1 family protein